MKKNTMMNRVTDRTVTIKSENAGLSYLYLSVYLFVRRC